MRDLPYEVKALLQKARESALLAVETYNRPTATFRSSPKVRSQRGTELTL